MEASMKKDNITKIIYILRQMNIKIKLITERLLRRLLSRLMSDKRRPGISGAGFVLPTVTMVMLVVLLLTIAISLRSFNRVEDARNVRVNQAVLSAAAPALDRAKAKLEELLVTNPPTTGTPSEDTIEIALMEDKFNFGDEDRLRISYLGETTDTAWRFRVDTDGDGTPDGYTIYGIFFKTPPGDTARSPLEARVPPQSSGSGNDNDCPGVLATSKEWIPDDVSGKLKKSFFVYAATVQDNKSGVSALEYQQDWSRTPLTNNAVVYENDLEIAPGVDLNLNGRIFTNSNLIIGPTNNITIRSYLVSSPGSCFYSEPDNSKIFVGGNVIRGLVERDDINTGTVTIDLMNGDNQGSQNLTTDNDSVDNTAQQAAYNSAAYRERINALVARVNDPDDDETTNDGLALNQLPQEVQDKINDGIDRNDAVETYFRKLTRKVPNAEDDCIINVDRNDPSCIAIEGTGNDLRPSLQNILVLPDDATTGVTLEEDLLEETPGLPEDSTEQLLLGDRIEVGNNLPQESWNGSELTEATMERGRRRTSQVQTLADVGSTDRDGFWEVSAAQEPENATEGIGGLRVITGAGIYATETGAYNRTLSFLPPPPPPPNMASVLGADYQVVWPDTMPMSPVDGSQIYDNNTNQWRNYDSTTTDANLKGDLQMRATVLYHYASDTGENPKDSNGNTLESQDPIACISSYYDPSTAITAQNIGAGGRSNNGIVYPPPNSNIGDQRAELDIQSKLIFPDGRLVNEPLKVALEHFDEGGRPNFTLADEAAIDAELCALDILDGTIAAGNTTIPDLDEGDIREVSFLDARQVKALDVDDLDTTQVDETFTANINDTFVADDPGTADDESASAVNFSTEQRLPLEERQPLEIRVTQLDLNALRAVTLTQNVDAGPKEGNNEYLLPMSGIIYASRNDALQDRTDPDSTYDNLGTSPEDFQLDPSRRPNGFMLVNGDRLARGTDGKSYNTLNSIVQEKGLLFVSNNPVYIKGDFNSHEVEEFTAELQDNWNNFYTRTREQRDEDFACRRDDPRTGCDGESWRAATVLADAVTVLSDNWETGYRNHGDFDLRNNGGNGILEPTTVNPVTMKQKRQFNGFFANSYATNGLSSGATIAIDDTPANNVTYNDNNYRRRQNEQVNSSYFNNFVTPVQRRINGFPEYVMEVCPKLSVYECEPNDWIVNWDINPTTGEIINAGTMHQLLTNSADDPTNPATPASNFTDTGSIDYFEDLDSDGLNDEFLRSDIDFAAEIAANNFDTDIPASDLESGTTVTTPNDVQRFPRRVAFLRNEYGELEMREIIDGANVRYTPIPIGVNDDGFVQAYPYPDNATFTGPETANNALWFRTTTNFDGRPNLDAEGTYVADEPLFYLAYDGNDRDNSGNKPDLPPTPTILDAATGTEHDLTVPDDPGTNGVDEEEVDSPYRYAFCLSDRTTQNYYALNEVKYTAAAGDATVEQRYYPIAASADCPADTITEINNLRTYLMGVANTLDDDTGGLPTITDGTVLEGDTNQDGMVVYEIPGGTITAGTILELEGDSDDIFVLRMPAAGSMIFSGTSGIQLNLLGGVNPNNIFWVSDGGMTFQGATASPHILVGNFIGNGVLDIQAETKILGGRFLGFSSLTPTAPATGVDIRAMTNQANPSLVPALQIHEPNADAAAGTLNGGNASRTTGWMVEAQETTFNLIIGSGDTPARPGQGNGGFQNFVRFQENWENPTQKATNISGAFIQLDRSKYATAPQQQILRADEQANVRSELFGERLRYESRPGQGILGFQTPPERNWGFDVGLLSQPPDLFALKFTLPPTDDPDQYFREVGIDDDWIRGLLCAETTDGANTDHRPDGTDCTNYQ
ncbi:MAG: hormogonium polysaccharide biosynthesis protein HpsA [Cyanobacteria bacterium P01_H01_bin.35]